MKIKLFASGKQYDVQGCYEGTSFTVLKGSKISGVTMYGLQRNALIKKSCAKDGENFLLVKDVVFRAPTTAANFCTGRSVNGWNFWKDSSNRPLNAIVEHKVTKRPRKNKESSNNT